MHPLSEDHNLNDMTNQTPGHAAKAPPSLCESVDTLTARAKRDAILQSASGTIISLDPQGHIISLNSYAEVQFAISQRTAIGVHVDKILNISDETSSSFFEWLKLLDLDTKISHSVVLSFNKADGSSELAEVTIGKAPLEQWPQERQAEGVSTVTEPTNTSYQYICVIHPLSTLKNSQFEDALKYLSHTLKTPLSGILGLITLALNESDLPAKSRKYLERASQSGETLSSIIDDTLEGLDATSETSKTTKKEAKPKQENLANEGKFRGKRILIVEDNATNQIIAKGMLRKFGVVPDVAENGEQALKAVLNNSYDLILMDCNMPIMDGYAATKLIRNLPAPKNTTPIVAITATQVSDPDSFCITHNMDGYLAKPYRLDDIYRSLNLWLTDS